ncbi:hypothetical protein IIY24_00785, partial [Candidatus Saccharibacteria bacterium]|nr:hypothetical protein [Candidatus Saccharibacteria bacterium]
MRKIFNYSSFGIILTIAMVVSIFFFHDTTYALGDINPTTTMKTWGKMSNTLLNNFSQNNILFYDPSDCVSGSNRNLSSNSCFKIDNNTSAQDSWYAEGCLNTGECSGGLYFASGKSPKSDNGLVVTRNNAWIYEDTKVDEEWGGMQYIYAENYDVVEYAGAHTKMTPNGGSSTRKYYWIVLPDQAYSNGFGETYVATFENFSEPIYFIVLDTHACPHQSEAYCEQAESNPDEVKIGKQFFGAFTKDAGNPTEAAKMAGRLTSLCRIEGSGEVTVSQDASKISTVSEGSPSTSTSSSSAGGSSSSESSTNSVSSGSLSSSGNTCAKLGELRTEMWNNASQSDKESFMQVVIEEDPSIAGVEGYMNQIVSKHGTDGTLSDWLSEQCPAFRGGRSCSESHTITSEEQGWINEALNGSNNIRFAIGNATGGSGVGAGKIVCVWDGNKCRDDVDYTVNDGKSGCSTYSPSYSFGECWGLEGEDDWAKEMESNCGSGCSSDPSSIPDDELTRYDAGDSRWAKRPSDSCGTMASCDCGVFSIAMLATVATGQEILPTDVKDFMESEGLSEYWEVGTQSKTMGNVDVEIGKKFGFQVEKVDFDNTNDAIEKMREYLKKGYMIHVSGGGADIYPFSVNGHYIGIYKINDNDEVYVANSTGSVKSRGGRWVQGGNQWIKLDELVKAGLSYGQFTAIRGSGSGECDTDNLCQDTKSTKIVSGGLTDEQAQKIADYYNSSAVNASEWGFYAGTKLNCVAFSQFFVGQFTTRGRGGSWPDGGNVAHRVAEETGLPEGTELKPFSVFSVTPYSHGYTQHTGIVVAVNGDEITTIEAAWQLHDAKVDHWNIKKHSWFFV